MSETKKINIAGAGLVGSLLSVFLAKKGFDVNVFEMRGDIRNLENYGGRSINLALSDRGWKALDKVGLSDEIKKISIPMFGRMIHAVNGDLSFQAYGKEDQAIYSVSRSELNKRLIELADNQENINFFFNHKCIDVNLDTCELMFQDRLSNKFSTAKADAVIATDGAFSAIRNKMQKTDRFNYSQMYLEHGYKELTIPPDENGNFRMEKNALHIWPRGNFMMIALPNPDASFTCTLFFPFKGEKSFESLSDGNKVLQFFKDVFPDTISLMPTLLEDFENNPTSSLVVIKSEPWNYKDKVLMIGDASHAIVPFYGQGMNSGFEDCTVLDEMMEIYGNDFEKLFPTYAFNRKPDTDAISDLALRNFIEMRDLVADENFLLRKKIEGKLTEKYPEKWLPLYSMVTFSDIPYSKALSEGKKHDKVFEKIMQIPDIKSKWDSEEVLEKVLNLYAEIK
jgi:kynurenine 3-monooxygenase